MMRLKTGASALVLLIVACNGGTTIDVTADERQPLSGHVALDTVDFEPVQASIDTRPKYEGFGGVFRTRMLRWWHW